MSGDRPPSPEKRRVPTPEQEEEAAAKMPTYSNGAIQESPEACEQRIKQFDAMLASYAEAHDLKALYAIQSLTLEEEKYHPIRTPAMLALPPIVALLTHLERQKAIPTERYREIFGRYKVIANATGFVNGGRLVHDR